MVKTVSNYIQLMKPTIMVLVLITGAASMVAQGNMTTRPGGFLMVLLGLLLTGGSANAFNMYFERDIDARMMRTSKRRPLPLRLLSPRNALVFAIVIGIGGVSIFALFFNTLSAVLALGTIVYYAFFYTLFLKPRTKYNIVIGGAAGSMAPVIAWAAAAGAVSITPLILFTIIFLWTPPHFWSLALYTKEDYETVGYPMLPVAVGDARTKRTILLYTLIVVLFSFLLYFSGAGLIYALIAFIAGTIFIYRAATLYYADSVLPARQMFGYSIVYLFVIFVGVMADFIFRI